MLLLTMTLPHLARLAAARLESHHACVCASARLEPVHMAVTTSRAKALSALAELFTAAELVPEDVLQSVRFMIEAVKQRGDALAVGSLDARVIETMAELVGTLARQLEDMEKSELGRTGT